VILSFRSKGLQYFFERGDSKRLSVQNTARIGRILRALEAAAAPEDMNIPGLRFHSLSGDQKGRFAVDASGNWRITFGWSEDAAVDVDLEDYH
jgi:proteic killer suppression protein